MLRKFLLLAIRSSVAYRLSQGTSGATPPTGTLAGEVPGGLPVHHGAHA